jgi:S-adenosylmethionine synthetase
MELNIEQLQTASAGSGNVEIVERKGRGHPDTLCDALAEQLSISLCKFYRERFGLILHHNVDKVLLYGGVSEPAFGGGRVKEPLEIFLAGRATREYKGIQVPVEELAIEGSREWLHHAMHALDPHRHVKIHCLIRPGSVDLVELYLRQQRTGVWLANDTSCGAGFAPLTDLERVVLEVETYLNSPKVKERFPEYGEDIKVMGTRKREKIVLTLACALVDRFVTGLPDYIDKKRRLAVLTQEAAGEVTRMEVAVEVNTGDDEASGDVYLTVTGTSAEAGDDGEAGRGNRVNGLITPYRPMTLEAAAGKNPMTHVGKLYNITAERIAAAIVEEISEISECDCYLVSQIGRPVADPQIVDVRLRTETHLENSRLVSKFDSDVRQIVHHHLSQIGTLWQKLLAGELRVC